MVILLDEKVHIVHRDHEVATIAIASVTFNVGVLKGLSDVIPNIPIRISVALIPRIAEGKIIVVVVEQVAAISKRKTKEVCKVFLKFYFLFAFQKLAHQKTFLGWKKVGEVVICWIWSFYFAIFKKKIYQGPTISRHWVNLLAK